MTDEPQDIPEVKRITVHPGDVLLVESDRHLAVEETDAIVERLQRVLPGNKVMVLGPGLTVSVVEPDEGLSRIEVIP